VGAGGDWIQASKTAAHLRALGVDVTLSTYPFPQLRRYDLVHLITLYTYKQAEAAIKYGCPVVVSPVYWNTAEYDGSAVPRGAVKRFFRSTVRQTSTVMRVRGFVTNYFRLRRIEPHIPDAVRIAWDQSRYQIKGRLLFQHVIDAARVLLPNSKMEAELLRHDFRVNNLVLPVPNGAEPKSEPARCKDPEKSPSQGYVLSVAARFSYRKNQLAIVKALRDSNLKFVFVGRTTNRLEMRYLEQCQSCASSSMTFINRSLGEDELLPLYQGARVHVLASWFETPGLVSLEAAMAGCAVVTTDRGSPREYFGELASYCSPGDVESIRTTVLAAWKAGPPPGLNEHVRANFTWRRVAEETIRGYELALGANSRS